MGQCEDKTCMPSSADHNSPPEGRNVGVIRELGELPSGTIITEKALGRVFDRHLVSIKRAIERGELPPSIRLFGEPVWTVKALQEHFNKRMEEAQKEVDRMKEKINKLGA
jgi:hypothetical protein